MAREEPTVDARPLCAARLLHAGYRPRARAASGVQSVGRGQDNVMLIMIAIRPVTAAARTAMARAGEVPAADAA